MMGLGRWKAEGGGKRDWNILSMNRNYWIGRTKDSAGMIRVLLVTVIEGKPQLETLMANHKRLKHS